jgi:hypothetical protein
MALDVDIVYPKKKWYKKTVFGDRPIEPVNMPPSKVEDFQQMDALNPTRRSNSKVRVTILDNEGNWMIHWPNTEMEIAKNNAILSNNVQYIDKEGNIITLFFDDYHGAYMHKSAFVKLILP